MNINNNFLVISALAKVLCDSIDTAKTSKNSIIMGGGVRAKFRAKIAQRATK